MTAVEVEVDDGVCLAEDVEDEGQDEIAVNEAEREDEGVGDNVAVDGSVGGEGFGGLALLQVELAADGGLQADCGFILGHGHDGLIVATGDEVVIFAEDGGKHGK